MFFFIGKTHKTTFLVHWGPVPSSRFFSVQDVLVGSTQLLVPAETPRQTFTYFVVYTRPLVDGWCGISWILETGCEGCEGEHAWGNIELTGDQHKL